MTTRVRMTVRAGDTRLARAIFASLRPDNVDFPPGLSMGMKRRGSSVEFTFTSDSITDTLISTVDEVFESCGVSLQGIRSAEES